MLSYMTVDHKFAKTGASSVLELLQTDVQFKVPKFQRNYSWDKEKAETLWNDLYENYKEFVDSSDAHTQESQYLLGPIVLVTDKDKPRTYHVIDGQQRLATLTMLFCVSRDIILDDLKYGNAAKPDGFDKILELIQNTRMGDFTSWKVKLNDTDKDLFEEIQQYEASNPQSQLDRIKAYKPKPKSKQFLKDNYVLLHEKITDMLYTNFGQDDSIDVKNMDEDEKRRRRIANWKTLLYFLTYIREYNFLIKIMVSDDGTAFQIFETLNERGQTLSKSNLIKNHILNQIDSKDTQDDLSDKWNEIFDKVVGNNQRDDDFIIESYQSRVSDSESLRSKSDNALPMSKKNLYKIIKKMVGDEGACKQLVKELKADADFLSTLNDPTLYTDDDSKDDIYAIRLLKAKFIRAPILAAYRKWYDSRTRDYSKLVRLLVKLFFKTRVVRQEHPSYIEQMASSATEMINQGKPVDDIITVLMSYDDHDDFKYDFEKRFMPGPPKDAAKYTLQKITIALGTEYDDVKPIDNLTLEHILPIKHDEWSITEFLGDHMDGKIDEFKNRLGNLTLLKKAVNSKIQNLPFAEKKDYLDGKGNQVGYLSSKLEINKETVCNYDAWTASTIKEREKRFANLADGIWRL